MGSASPANPLIPLRILCVMDWWTDGLRVIPGCWPTEQLATCFRIN